MLRDVPFPPTTRHSRTCRTSCVMGRCCITDLMGGLVEEWFCDAISAREHFCLFLYHENSSLFPGALYRRLELSLVQGICGFRGLTDCLIQ